METGLPSPIPFLLKLKFFWQHSTYFKWWSKPKLNSLTFEQLVQQAPQVFELQGEFYFKAKTGSQRIFKARPHEQALLQQGLSAWYPKEMALLEITDQHGLISRTTIAGAAQSAYNLIYWSRLIDQKLRELKSRGSFASSITLTHTHPSLQAQVQLLSGQQYFICHPLSTQDLRLAQNLRDHLPCELTLRAITWQDIVFEKKF